MVVNFYACNKLNRFRRQISKEDTGLLITNDFSIIKESDIFIILFMYFYLQVNDRLSVQGSIKRPVREKKTYMRPDPFKHPVKTGC